MKAIVDRIEGEYIVLEVDIDNFILYPYKKAPFVKEGDVVEIINDKLKVLNDETKMRKEKIQKLVDNLFKWLID